MNERGTVPKLLSILTCRKWKNVAPCRNHCPYWHVRNERAWHRAETTVHTDISGMNKRGPMPKPLSILTCQELVNSVSLAAPCRNLCPYWHVRNEWIAVWWHTDYISRTECRHPDYTTVRTDQCWPTSDSGAGTLSQLLSVLILLGAQRVELFILDTF